jgi:hypothetical protein
MGIYDSGVVYGIKIYEYRDDFPATLYEKTSDGVMNQEEKKNAYLAYCGLQNKSDIYFSYYTECSTSYEANSKPMMMWCPIELFQFVELFNV